MNNSVLSPHILVKAYSVGLFPMADMITGEISWYKPDPRAIIPLGGFHISRSLKKFINKNHYRISYSEAFTKVMRSCSNRSDTWISENLVEAYSRMNRMGAAHSVEVWEGEELVGGVYGLSLGGAFFAESMFHTRDNTSKLALYYLVEKLKHSGFTLLECQYMTDHLESLGAKEISDEIYQEKLQYSVNQDVFFKI